jgi:hypothetical protein
MAGNEWAVHAYLEPPGVAPKERRFFGHCERRNKDLVKAAGGRWCAVKNLWYAASEAALLRMMATRLWFPQGFPDPSQMIAFVKARLQAAEDAERAKEREEAQRISAKMRAAHEKAEAEQAEKARLQAASKAAFVRRDIGIPDDEPELLRELFEKHGIPPEHVPLSGSMPRLGPRAGISDALRVRRAFTMGVGEGRGWLARDLKLAQTLRESARKSGTKRSRAEADMVRAWEAERAAGGPSQ